MPIGGLLKPPLAECCATFILRGGRETFTLSFIIPPPFVIPAKAEIY
jgi:hypothetical protein